MLSALELIRPMRSLAGWVITLGTEQGRREMKQLFTGLEQGTQVIPDADT